MVGRLILFAFLELVLGTMRTLENLFGKLPRLVRQLLRPKLQHHPQEYLLPPLFQPALPTPRLSGTDG